MLLHRTVASVKRLYGGEAQLPVPFAVGLPFTTNRVGLLPHHTIESDCSSTTAAALTATDSEDLKHRHEVESIGKRQFNRGILLYFLLYLATPLSFIIAVSFTGLLSISSVRLTHGERRPPDRQRHNQGKKQNFSIRPNSLELCAQRHNETVLD